PVPPAQPANWVELLPDGTESAGPFVGDTPEPVPAGPFVGDTPQPVPLPLLPDSQDDVGSPGSDSDLILPDDQIQPDTSADDALLPDSDEQVSYPDDAQY